MPYTLSAPTPTDPFWEDLDLESSPNGEPMIKQLPILRFWVRLSVMQSTGIHPIIWATNWVMNYWCSTDSSHLADYTYFRKKITQKSAHSQTHILGSPIVVLFCMPTQKFLRAHAKIEAGAWIKNPAGYRTMKETVQSVINTIRKDEIHLSWFFYSESLHINKKNCNFAPDLDR